MITFTCLRWGNPPHYTSRTWGPPPSCKQALNHAFLLTLFPDVQKLCVVTSENTIFKTSTKVFQIVWLSLNFASKKALYMLIRPTILSLLQMPFSLNLTDSPTFNCVFLIDYIFICYFVIFFCSFSLKLATFSLRHLAIYLCRSKCICMWAFKRDKRDWISCTHLIMTPMRSLASTSVANLDHSLELSTEKTLQRHQIKIPS